METVAQLLHCSVLHLGAILQLPRFRPWRRFGQALALHIRIVERHQRFVNVRVFAIETAVPC